MQNKQFTNSTEYQSLDIFGSSSHAQCLSITEVQRWFDYSKPLLRNMLSDQLVGIFSGLADSQVYDREFVNELCSSIVPKLDELSYSNLTDILGSLHEMKHSSNVEFIAAVVTKLVQREECESHKHLVKSIWLLAKMGFHDEAFFAAWIRFASPVVQNFDAYDLTQSLQGCAKLKFFDRSFMEAWVGCALERISEFDQRALLNNSFYLTMISVNSFSPSDGDPIRLRINDLVTNMLDRLNLDELQDVIEKRQVLQIYAAKIWRGSERKINKLEDSVKECSITNPSYTQKKPEAFIKRKYPMFRVTSESYEERTMSYVDLVVDRTHELANNVYIEVDGPSHYFINRQPATMKEGDNSMLNASTEFRNKLYALNSINLHIIPYMDIDYNTYRSGLVSVLDRYPEGHWDPKQSEAPRLEDNYAKKQSDEVTSVQKVSAGKKKNSKKGVSNPKVKQANKISDTDFDALLQEFELTTVDSKPKDLNAQYEGIKTSYSKKRNRYKTYNLLFIAILEKDFAAVEVILDYYKNNKTSEEFNSFLLNGKSKEGSVNALEFTLQKFCEGVEKDATYLDIWSLIYSYSNTASVNEFCVMGLIYSFAAGKVETFTNFLGLYPESENKKQLMEFFFINCGITNNVEIASLLLNKGVDINACYSRESVEVLYAFAFGKYHSGRAVQPTLISSLVPLLHRAMMEPQSVPMYIENLLQNCAPGNMDKAEGVPQGRGITALHASCYEGKERDEIRQLLLKANANLNTMNGLGFTPLMTTLTAGHEDAALQVLDFKPNINLKARSDITALHLAAYQGFDKVVSKMLSMGCMTLDVAIKKGGNAVGDKYKFVFYQGDTPICIALKNGNLEIVKSMIHAKPDLNLNFVFQAGRATLSGTPLMYAIMNYPELVTSFLEAGADINMANNTGVTPLMVAAELANYETRKKVNGQEGYEKAIEFQKHKTFEQLLMNGAGIEFKDNDGDEVDEYALHENHVSKHCAILAQIRMAEKGVVDMEKRKQIIDDNYTVMSHTVMSPAQMLSAALNSMLTPATGAKNPIQEPGKSTPLPINMDPNTAANVVFSNAALESAATKGAADRMRGWANEEKEPSEQPDQSCRIL